MKKKLLIFSMIGALTFGVVGCESDDIITHTEINTNQIVDTANTNRFIDTGDSYKIEGGNFSVYYDSKTNIVYIVNKNIVNGGWSRAITVLYNSEGKPMTIDEYNETK